MNSLIVSLMLVLTNTCHVGKLAEYYISQKDNTIHMKVILENEEMLGMDFKSNCDVQKMTSLCVANHILDNLNIELNGKNIVLNFDKSFTESGHLILFFSKEITTKNIQDIKIKNNCFYRFYKKYRNRIILNIGHFQSSYLLTKKNNEFSVK